MGNSKGRILLQPGDNISLSLMSKSNQKNYRVFVIDEIKSDEGASSIVYVAHYIDGSSGFRGVLKEFFPVLKKEEFDNNFAPFFSRKNGLLVYDETLITPENIKDKFETRKIDYLNSYKQLAKKTYEDKINYETIIPHFEIYYGGETVYIWTPEPPMETFEEICKTIQLNPRHAREKKLSVILHSIRELANAIRLIHEAGFLHRDIKPENIGFLKRDGDTLDQTVSLFDVDTICGVDSEERHWPVISEFYTSPEISEYNNSASVKTDIYSIGATLFHALIITNEMRDKANPYLYETKYYDRLKDLVDTSELINGSEYNSNPYLREILTRILKKSLFVSQNKYSISDVDDESYYSATEELIRDLDEAIKLIPSSESLIDGNKRWVLRNVDVSSDDINQRNISLACLQHLYNNPLYKGFNLNNDSDMEKPVRIMFFGFSYFGQKFLDATMQMLQMPRLYLDATIVSQDKESISLYEQDRPLLWDFFVSDREKRDKNDYGVLEFCSTHDVNIYLNDIKNYKYKYNVYFIDLGKGCDEENLEIANSLRNYDPDAVIHFAYEKNVNIPEDENFSIFDPTQFDVGEDLLFMAMNVHSVWNGSQNQSYGQLLDEKDVYNHDSSISNALSIKYKLYGVNIDIDKLGAYRASEEFERKKESDATLITELMYYEHRRWVSEKICQGWKKRSIEDTCTDGKTSDMANRKHVCLLKSERNQNLYEATNGDNGYLFWDSETTDLSKFDELDRMSILLHRKLKEIAKEALEHDYYNIPIRTIEALIDDTCSKEEVLGDYRLWKKTMTDIRINGRERAGQYTVLKDNFKKSVKEYLSKKEQINIYIEIEESIKQLDKFFIPILLSSKYTDYKRFDIDLVDEIPFILINRQEHKLLIPIELNNNANDMFKCVMAPIVIIPKEILYAIKVSSIDEIKSIIELDATLNSFYKKRSINTKVKWIIIVEPSMQNDICNFLNNSKSVCYEISSSKNMSSITELLDKDFLIEMNDTQLLNELKESISDNSLIYYSINYTLKKGVIFKDDNGNRILWYYKNHSSLSVNEMIDLGHGKNVNYIPPEFYLTYTKIWNWCHGNSENLRKWKYMCDVLKKYHKDNDIMSVIPKVSHELNKCIEQEFKYVLPSNCRDSVRKIMDYLLKEGVLLDSSKIKGLESDTIVVKLVTKYKEYDDSIWITLFYPVYRLMDKGLIYMYKTTKDIRICYRDLCAVIDYGFLMKNKYGKDDKEDSKKTAFYTAINKAKGWGYVQRLSKGTISYSSVHARELLESAGKFLEVNIFHELKSSGSFDDVVCGYEIFHKGGGVNEVDIIATKDYSSVFIECKARDFIEDDFYDNLLKLKNRYGVNASAILIIDTSLKHLKKNEMDTVSKYEKKGIRTIYKRRDIMNIAEVVLGCMS